MGEMLVKVFLLDDIQKVGLSGEIVSVSDGFAQNYLLPRKLAVEVTASNERSFARRARVIDKRHEVIESKTSMLAERIKGMKFVLRRKVHDSDRLYAAITSTDIVELLAAQEKISVAKNQVVIEKTIKKTGVYPVTIKLSSRLQPVITVEVVAEPV